MAGGSSSERKVWAADTEVPAALAVRLIEGRFPKLAPVRLEPLGEGWDNTAFRVNGAFVFRFPRRAAAAHLIEKEAEFLPRLEAHLPLPVPRIRWLGEPADGYPYRFSGYPLLPGVTACRVPLADTDRGALAEPLAAFLRVLHGIPVDAAEMESLPGDELQKANLARVLPRLAERISRCRPQLRPLVDRLASAEITRRRCWLHGDLYARHLLLDDQRKLCGVIDWGDVHVGDPAMDLSIAFTFLPPGARKGFREAYGGVDDDTWSRAQFRALHYGVVLLEYGQGIGDDALTAAGAYALDNA